MPYKYSQAKVLKMISNQEIDIASPNQRRLSVNQVIVEKINKKNTMCSPYHANIRRIRLFNCY